MDLKKKKEPRKGEESCDFSLPKLCRQRSVQKDQLQVSRTRHLRVNTLGYTGDCIGSQMLLWGGC